MKKTKLCVIIPIFFFAFSAFAEYRTYMLEVYDLIDQTRWELETGFSPDKYILTHGGKDRIALIIKATWMCYNSTAHYREICQIPEPLLPKFKLGDRVKINLDKHHTHDWEGIIEVALWREDLKSNVYGVRFEGKRKLYARYFEANLIKILDPVIPPDNQQPQLVAQQ